jgi:quercetin dioxygenase-like cupin family protein
MRVGFGRFHRDATFILPDGAVADQLVAPTTGALVLRADQAQLHVRAGEFVYLPAGHAGEFYATDDTEAVLVYSQVSAAPGPTERNRLR